MTATVWTYLIYFGVCAAITNWVARTLQKNGAVYVTDGDIADSPLAVALSHLLTVGFYLVNFGFISLALKYGGGVQNAQSAIELLSTKIGAVLLGLGCMHFLILGVLANIRKNRDEAAKPIFESRYNEPLAAAPHNDLAR